MPSRYAVADFDDLLVPLFGGHLRAITADALCPDVLHGSAALGGRRRQPGSGRPVGERDQMRPPPIACRREPQVTVRTKTLQGCLAPFGKRPSLHLIHRPSVAYSPSAPRLSV